MIESFFESIDSHHTIAKAKFEDFPTDLTRTTHEALEKALREAEMGKSVDHEIVMSGGSLRIGRTAKLLQDFLASEKPNEGTKSDETLAYVAATRVAMLSGYKSEVFD